MELDPRWEYWTPSDPDVADILEAAAAGVSRVDELFDRRQWEAANLGLRYGRGNPDRACFRLGRERRERVYESRCRVVPCRACSVPFEQRRPDRVFCSRRCSAVDQWGERERSRPLESSCEGCRAVFRPVHPGQRYCSRGCAGRAAGAAFRVESVGSGGCPVCGGEVGTSRSNNGRPKVYCSRKCTRLAVSRRSRAKAVPHSTSRR